MVAAKYQTEEDPAANPPEQEDHQVEPITYLAAGDEVEEEEDAATAEFVAGLAKSLIRNTYDQIKEDQQPPKEEAKEANSKEQNQKPQASVPATATGSTP